MSNEDDGGSLGGDLRDADGVTNTFVLSLVLVSLLGEQGRHNSPREKDGKDSVE